MIPHEARDVVTALLHKTRAGEAKWQRSRFAGGRDVYIDLGPYVVHVYEGREKAVYVRLSSDSAVGLLSFSVDPDDPDFALASELLDHAYRMSVNLDGVLSDVRRLVEQAGPVG